VNNLSRNSIWRAAIVAGGMLLVTGTGMARDDQKHPGGKAGRVPLPVHAIAKGEKCVEPTDEMRRNHMEKILHQRDETMHRGIRTTQHSLKNCIDCHADPKTHSVLGKDGFCESCHRYTSVSIDCFSCHSAEREAKAAEPAPASSPRALRAAARGKKP
jgi:hypothetical protein